MAWRRSSSRRSEEARPVVVRLPRDPSASDVDGGHGGNGGGTNLHWEYEAVTGRLESLHAVQEAAVAHLAQSRERIHAAFTAFAALRGFGDAGEAAGARE